MVLLKKPSHVDVAEDRVGDPINPTMGVHTPYRDDPETAEPGPPSYGALPTAQAKRPSRSYRRIIGAALLALTTIIILRNIGTSWTSSDKSPQMGEFPGSPASPPAGEGHLQHLANWSPPAEVPDRKKRHDSRANDLPWYSSVANFTLPYTTSTGLVFLHNFKAGAGHSANNVRVITDPSLSSKDEVKIGVETIFHYPSVRDALWVGQLVRDEERSEGVGIYWNNSHIRDPYDCWVIDIYVHIRLPPKDSKSLSSNSVPFLPAIEIKTHAAGVHWQVAKDNPSLTPRSVSVNNVAGSVSFDYLEAVDSVSLYSMAGSIVGDTSTDSEVSTKAVTVKSTAGHIHGSFRVVDRLDLVTMAGSIASDIYLPGKKDNSSEFSFTKESEYVQSSPNVTVHSNAGSVRLNYLQQHPSVELHSQASSNAGSMKVQHDANYQGKFVLFSNTGSAGWTTGEGKKTQVDSNRKGPAFSRVEGKVWLDVDNGWSKKGSSSIETRAGSIEAVL